MFWLDDAPEDIQSPAWWFSHWSGRGGGECAFQRLNKYHKMTQDKHIYGGGQSFVQISWSKEKKAIIKKIKGSLNKRILIQGDQKQL